MLLAGLVAVVVAGGPLLAAPAEKPSAPTNSSAVQLRVVQTWGDLTNQPHIDAGDGVTVRLGIGANHAPLNSGVLIYCLTDGYNYYKVANITRNALGPLSVIEERGKKQLVVTNDEPVMLRCKGWNTVEGCTLFFAKSVLIDAPGRYEITIRTKSGRELGRSIIDSDATFYHPWTPFRMEADSEWKRVSYAIDEENFRQTKPAVLSVPGVGIATDRWEGFDFQVYSGRANRGGIQDTEDFKPKNPASPLPQVMPDKPDPDLQLSVENGLVTISSRDEVDSARPDWHLLARWWVNGKPFVPKVGHAPIFGGGEVGHSDKSIRFKLKLDPAKLGARSGDRVAVQLLLCDMWCYLENPVTNMGSGRGNTRLTNKAEFTVQ